MDGYDYIPPEIDEVLCTDNDTDNCDTGLDGVCSDGTSTCTGGVWGSCVQDTASSQEICTGNLDEDCDGLTDCDDTANCNESIYCLPCANETQSCNMTVGPVCCSGFYCRSADDTCYGVLVSETGYCDTTDDEDDDGDTDCDDSDCYLDSNCCSAEGETCNGVDELCCNSMTCASVTGGTPTAMIDASATAIPAGTRIYYNGSGTDSGGSIVSYRWAFGDGYGASTQQNLSRIYYTPGNHTTVLTVTDNSGFIGSTYINITVTGSYTSIPIITATADVYSGAAPLTVQFNATRSDPDNITYSGWDFGWGSGTSSLTPSRTFTDPGNYTVMFYTKDGEDFKINKILNITVIGNSTICVSGAHAADTNADGCIQTSEMRAYVRVWKGGTATISELVDAFGLWKARTGC